MNRRQFCLGVGVIGVAAISGCSTRTAVDSEVAADAYVTEIDRHSNVIETTIEVENREGRGGTVGLHIHYWKGETLHHTHMPTTHLEPKESKMIEDTFEHDPDGITSVTAHVHE